jgi:hypothetical protein
VDYTSNGIFISLKREEIMTHAPTLRNLEDIMVSEIKLLEKRQIPYESTYISSQIHRNGK